MRGCFEFCHKLVTLKFIDPHAHVIGINIFTIEPEKERKRKREGRNEGVRERESERAREQESEGVRDGEGVREGSQGEGRMDGGMRRE